MKLLISLIFLVLSGISDRLLAQFDYPMQAEQVAPNVYAIVTPTRDLPNTENGGWNSNSAFVITDAGVLLFDSGSSTGIGQSLRTVIAAITRQPVRWIINSHAHGDHWLGNAAFDDTVEIIFASQPVIDAIEHGGQGWVNRFQRMTGGITGESEIRLPDRAVNQRTELLLGGKRLVLMPSGGSHSPGDLMLWLPGEKVLIGGDVIYSDRMPSTNSGSLRQWITTLETLQAMQPQAVIPGHGAVTDISGIENLHALLSEFWLAVERGLEDGLSDYEMLPLVSEQLARFKPAYPGLDEKLKRDISHVFLQVEAAVFE